MSAPFDFQKLLGTGVGFASNVCARPPNKATYAISVEMKARVSQAQFVLLGPRRLIGQVLLHWNFEVENFLSICIAQPAYIQASAGERI
jgi:hypothetical protein